MLTLEMPVASTEDSAERQRFFLAKTKSTFVEKFQILFLRRMKQGFKTSATF